MTALALISSWFNANQVLIENILIAALLAFSIQVALRSGIFSLAGVGFYAIGSYAAALLVKDGWPAVPAILAALALTVIIAYVLAVVLVRLRDLYLAMATFAFDLMVGVVALNWIGPTGAVLGVNLIPVSVSLLGLILTTLGVAALLTLMETGTLGRTLAAIREDEQLAVSFAVDARRYRRFAFVVSGMLGCLAGAVHALIFNVIEPQDAGFNLIVLALTMVILGGFGSWVGAAIGAFLLTWIPLRLTAVGTWWPVYYGGATVLVATFVPGGFTGLLRRLLARRRGPALAARRCRRAGRATGRGRRRMTVVDPAPVATPVLVLDDVHVALGGVHAVDGASLAVGRGMPLGVIGPNGSGKSTLLAAISRLINVSSGRLYMDGVEYTAVPPHRATAMGISRTFQTVRPSSTMTVLQNVMVGAATRAVQRSPLDNWLLVPRTRSAERQARAVAEAALERVGMQDFYRSFPQDLPYGRQRKVEIARALASDPKLLLLDEPTAGMSHAERNEVGDVMMELNAGGLTQLLVEHDLAMIHRVCSHAVAINFGRVIAEGTPHEVAGDPQVREAYMGHGAAGAAASAVGEAGRVHGSRRRARTRAGGRRRRPRRRGLSVRYGHVNAVRDVSLQVGHGEVVAVLGANGAGKSSTLRAISGAAKASITGEVRLFGERVLGRRAHSLVARGMVLVPEGRQMIAPMTVEENLLLGAHRLRSRSRRGELLEEVFELFPVLRERRRQVSGLLSGGEQQMLAFGRAFMSDPRLILMDEPSMGLSPLMVDRVMDAVREFNRRGRSILLVEQNAHAALGVASRVYVLDQGHIVRSGPAAEVGADPIVAQAFLGLREEADRAERQLESLGAVEPSGS